MFKRIGVLLLAATIGSFCLELGEQISMPGVHGLVSRAEARSRPPADAGERRRRCAENRTALCSWCLLLLAPLPLHPRRPRATRLVQQGWSLLISRRLLMAQSGH